MPNILAQIKKGGDTMTRDKMTELDPIEIAIEENRKVQLNKIQLDLDLEGCLIKLRTIQELLKAQPKNDKGNIQITTCVALGLYDLLMDISDELTVVADDNLIVKANELLEVEEAPETEPASADSGA